MYARFALFVIPGVILAMTIALDSLWKRSRVIGVAALAILALASAADLLTRPPKQPLRDAVEFAMEEAAFPQEILAVGLNVGAIRIYAPDLLFTTHATGDLAQLSDEQAIRQVIVYYPHLLTREQEQALRDAGFALARTFAGWADWGRGDVQVWRRQ